MIRKRTPRRRTLSSLDKIAVASMIDEVDKSLPLSWEEICSLVAENKSYRWSRQSLQSHAAIRAAYANHRAAYRSSLTNGGASTTRLSRHAALEATIKRLRCENEELKETLRQYDELLIRHLVNAIDVGVTIERLEMPLSRPYKKRTDLDDRRGGKRKVRAVGK